MPGWHSWEPSVAGPVFNTAFGPIRIRREAEETGRVRAWPAAEHANVVGVVHGGFVTGFIDIALAAGIAGARAGAVPPVVTVDLTTHFVAGGRVGIPMDAVVEIVREARRLIFLRGTIEQDGTITATFSAIMTKVRPV